LSADAEPEVARAARFRPWRWLLGGLLFLLALAGAAIWAIDTGPGHRFLVDRIAALPIKSGLKIRIGRIDGSIWHRATIRDLRLYDTKGLFLEAPEVQLEWHPLAWLSNRLDVDALSADLVALHRLPQLRATGEAAVLPGFDVHVGRLAIARLELASAVTGGAPRAARLSVATDLRDRRATAALDAAVIGGGDRVRLRLDAQPDADRFDLDVSVVAPARSAIGGLLGTARPIDLQVAGDGRWSDWAGTARLALSGRRVADLALGAKAGRYTIDGRLAPSPFLTGKLQRLTAPMVRVTGGFTVAERRVAGTWKLRSAALALDIGGAVDLATSRFDRLILRADLLRPPALFPNMTARRISLKALLDGPFRTAAFSYLATAPQLAFDQTGFEDVRAAGKGRLSAAPVSVPIRLTARRVTGVGDVAGGILAGLTVDGVLKVTAKTLTGTGLNFDSDKLRGKLSLLVDLVTGRYDVTVSGQLTRYLIPGLGIVDVTTELGIVPDPSGRGTAVEGRGRAWVRRFDNAFLRGLAGGLAVHRDAPGPRSRGRAPVHQPAADRALDHHYRQRHAPPRRHLPVPRAGPPGAIWRLRPRPRRPDRPAADRAGAGRPRRRARPRERAGDARSRPHRLCLSRTGGSTLGPFTSHGRIDLPSARRR
jgi:translocation and assembly module TamB